MTLSAAADSLQPNDGQRQLIERGYGMFIHFGVNTFNQVEWSDGKLPASSFNPTALDCDQWIQTAKEAGFRHVILVTKHHDGFCLWDSKYTDYDVASSPAKTDIVAEVAKACRKYGVKLGLYYSLWDRREPSHGDKDPAKYVMFMKNQLTELLTNYGDICELWFDGGWAKPDADWNFPEVYAHIKSLQPDCQVTVNHTIHIPGQPLKIRQPEDYVKGDPIRYWPVDFRTKDPNLVRADDPKEFTSPDGQLRYLPFEHTICLSDRWNWFQKKDIIPARTPDELEDLFYWCTANDNVLLVNLPPDQTGRIRENEREAIFKVADQLGIRGGQKPLPSAPVNQAAGVPAEADSIFSGDHDASKAVDGSLERTRWAAKETPASLTLSPVRPFIFDRISIHEYADMKDLGDNFSQLRTFRVQAFTIEAMQDGVWKTIHTGQELGAAKILRFDRLITAEKLRLRITKASAPASTYLITVADSNTRGVRGSTRPVASPSDSPAPAQLSTDGVAAPISVSSSGLSPAPLADTLETAFSSPRFVLTSGAAAPPGLRLEHTRDRAQFRFRLVNDSSAPVAVREVMLADIAHGFSAQDAFYGEGFNMFSSTGGTVGAPVNLEKLTDENHYRLPRVEGFRTVYNYLHATSPGGVTTLIGFTSAKRFNCRLNVNAERLQIVVMTEDLTLAPGASWDLEELVVASATDTAALLDAFAARILTYHPRLPWPQAPNGWCSWYAYYDKISAELVNANVAALKANAPGLRYIQIDDGYQPWMGDWLESTAKFAGGVQPVIHSIREAGFEPAIWVAPFIASPGSRLFREHPEWFVRGADDLPLRSDRVTFGGWRQGPWYMLDATHPGARAYLEHVFRTLREWGCTYFKLDANLWGSFPAGRRHDPDATSIEAYRLGMEAIRRGAGPDSLLLGCNHAYWPSLGTVHASRTSYDVNGNLAAFRRVARQNLPRNWMNNRLWWNDPDCLLIPDVTPSADGFASGPTLAGKSKVTPDQFGFHAAATYASGGLILSGDAVVDYSSAQWAILHRAFGRPPLAARFEGNRLEVGVIDESKRRVVALLNWENTVATRRIPVATRFAGASVRVTDFWSGEVVHAAIATDFELNLPPDGGRVLVLEPAPASNAP